VRLQVWQSLFSVRSLVVPMHEDVDAWLKFASLCRKSGRPRQVRVNCVRRTTAFALKTLGSLSPNEPVSGSPDGQKTHV
jgi:hypothetical protein